MLQVFRASGCPPTLSVDAERLRSVDGPRRTGRAARAPAPRPRRCRPQLCLVARPSGSGRGRRRLEVPLPALLRRRVRRDADAVRHPPPDRARGRPVASHQPHRHRSLRPGRLHQPRHVLPPLHANRRRTPRRTSALRPAPASPAASSSCSASTPQFRRSNRAQPRRTVKTTPTTRRHRDHQRPLWSPSTSTTSTRPKPSTPKPRLRAEERHHPQRRFRWVTVHQADHPELELALMLPGPPMDRSPPTRSAGSSRKARCTA